MSILVTGGAGYIGSHTVRELFRTRDDIVVYDNLTKGHRAAVKGFPFAKGDLHDTAAIAATIDKYNVTGVIHFAAFIEVGESMSNPHKYYHNNVGGTLNLLAVMQAKGVKNFIFSSTAAVYGEPDQIPVTEEASLQPTSVYGRTKLMIERMLTDLARSNELRYIALRYFNVAGADADGDIGEDHDPETHIIPLIIKTLLGRRDRFQIFGTDYPTEDGTCVRDYIHVTDLAQAHVLAMNWLEQGGESRVYNLGNGSGFSNRQIIEMVERITGSRLEVTEAGRRPGDPALLIASSQKITRELGWTPRFHTLETIIETAWRWHRGHPDGYRRNLGRVD